MNLLDVFLSLSALIILEIILGIDNLVLLSILSERLPPNLRQKARRWGLTFAWMTRLLLLASALWLSKLTKPFFSVFDLSFSYRDLFMIFGGVFLLAKATGEIHHEVEEETELVHVGGAIVYHGFFWVVLQIALMDIIFSLDSVLTAIGLTQHFTVMAIAITVAIAVMILASDWVSEFINKHPTIKMLALSFLMLIGMVLIADGFSYHIPRGYIYFSMGFSLAVESLNILRRSRRRSIKR